MKEAVKFARFEIDHAIMADLSLRLMWGTSAGRTCILGVDRVSEIEEPGLGWAKGASYTAANDEI